MSLEKRIRDGVTGWRGILGWIGPAVESSSHIVDFHSVVPEGIDLKIVNLGMTAHNEENVEMALGKIDDAASRLAFWGAKFIIVAGTPLVSFKGFGFDKKIIQGVEKLTKVPTTTSLTSAVDALQALNVKKVVIASPMNHEADERNMRFLEDSGFEIIHIRSLNMLHPKDIEALPRSAAYTLARQAYAEAPQAEGIYIPCGAWCHSWVIDCLERDLGVPVVTGRQSSAWAGLRSLGIKEPVKGWGRLFEIV